MAGPFGSLRRADRKGGPLTRIAAPSVPVVMGSLWLAALPLTAGTVGGLQGMRCMGTLYGIAVFSRLAGGFLGAWLGGALNDRFGDDNAVRRIGVATSLFSAACRFPVRETPLPAPRAAA